ncbi:hypothetical protein WJ0W_002074 [Paenibacillus melissococcoides]|uniref:Uncharacterized protein n=1 Tax=Paenibacillus melissococcoides TaxID=2912268 RepID=A0ABM9FZU4_9BACL|nr:MULTISPECIES: hypothetical protein [Paenibacillus]MEB9892607.1 hypothetical protein [Bacillus cereus]CAH8244843.1 hypothetical protein WJ0W_002074 [Paenibacillus melissococcoides]CAH8709141.1 hypothetical protein WDD9_002156 [Paenibacillus melissococcoides]CAH8709897.1 hypothetical protein HTL2_002444 [Paenibacillus melissococcoides]GIO82394.1 hypothetical protein J6TS7_60040 [Paenibacillus dendritiformis]
MRKAYASAALVISLVCALFSPALLAHPGKTDANGGTPAGRTARNGA